MMDNYIKYLGDQVKGTQWALFVHADCHPGNPVRLGGSMVVPRPVGRRPYHQLHKAHVHLVKLMCVHF